MIRFRCGFLGALHFEVFCERLSDEYGVKVVSTRPSVPFLVRRRQAVTTKVHQRKTDSLKKRRKAELEDSEGKYTEEIFDSPSDFPSPDEVKSLTICEPMCVATVLCPGDMQVSLPLLLRSAYCQKIQMSNF